MDTVVLMLPAFCECLILIGIFSYLGLHVIKREIIFVDLALAQIAALGALVGFLFGIALHTAASYCFSLAFAAVGGAVFTVCRTREGRIPQEAVIGLVYAIAAAMTILLIDRAPHGAEHIKEIFTGALLWVNWPTVGITALVCAVVGAFHYVFRSRFLLLSEDPAKAEADGLNVRAWDFLFYLSFALVVTLSVATVGVLLVFVFLVAPAVIALLLTGRLVGQLFVGWGLGLVVTVVGLVLAYVGDFSTGPMVIGCYAVVLVVIATITYNVRAKSRPKAVGNTVVATLAFAVILGAIFAMGRLLGGAAHGDHHHGHAPSEADSGELEEPGLTDADIEAQLATTTDPAALVQLYEKASTPDLQGAVVRRAIEVDPKTGARLGIRFLEGDPPRFFAAQVMEALAEATGNTVKFVPGEPFDSPKNREAAEAVKEQFGL
jgi:zinc/manganese transport system permease protein